MQPRIALLTGVLLVLPIGNLRHAVAATSDDSLFTRLDKDADGSVAPAEIAPEHQRLFARLVSGADEDGDGALSAAEFAAGISPDRPEKLVESNQPNYQPGLQAVRLMLLKLDVNRDSRLTKTEAPAELKSAFTQLAEQVDANDDDILDRFELGRVGPQMGRVAVRVAVQQRWRVAEELAAIEKEQGAAADRFDKPMIEPGEMMGGNPERATEFFAQLDANSDGKVSPDELPEQLKTRLGPLFRRGDTNGDGAVSVAEFRTASERMAQFQKRMGNGSPMPRRKPKS